MTAEIISVGTELLLGEITNTNAQYLAEQLAHLGIAHYYQNVVGDNKERIAQVIDIAINRGARILIFTGGLGPTPDDLTTAAIAEYFQTPLVENQEILANIREKFAERSLPMSSNNSKQALLPEGAQILPNPKGTAPGIIWHVRSNLLLLTFPGVPYEMMAMWEQTAVPYLKKLGWGKQVIHSKMLRFLGIGESTLAAKIAPFFELKEPAVAPYVSKGEVRLRISAKASSEKRANELIEPVAEQIKAIAGLDYYGCDEDNISSVVGNLLVQSKQTISIAESCTGGGLGELITSTAGSSLYFQGGFITYANQCKINLLGVNPKTIEEYGAVSKQVAIEMAKGAVEKTNSDWAISITGIAGPGGGKSSKPVGLVYIGIANQREILKSFEFKFGSNKDRQTIRYLSASAALDQLRRLLIEQKRP